MKTLQFTGDEIISDILQALPEAGDIFSAYNLSCSSCHINVYEKLKDGVLGHGYNEKTLKNVLKELNELCLEKKISKKEFQKKALSLTPSCAKKIQDLHVEMDMVGFGFKVEAIEESDGGHSFFLDFQERPDRNDRVFVSHNVQIFIPSGSIKYLQNNVIDYVVEAKKEGFRVLSVEDLRKRDGDCE